MRKWAIRLSLVVLAAMILATFVGLVAVDAWWIRVFDFPRLQFVLVIVLAMALLLVLRTGKPWLWGGLGLLALGFQLFQLYPYSPLVAKQAVAAARCSEANRLALLSVNVLQSNRDYGRMLGYLKDADADIILAMETDAEWVEALSPLEAQYPHGRKIPLSNSYGMALWSRLPLTELEDIELAGDETPLIRARVEMPSGQRPALFAVHPLPPRPGQSSSQRDAELILLADLVRESGRPTLVIGDFNDVPWSRVVETFQRVGQLVDPRRGRGFYASFDATNPFMRWPLDHVFHTDDFGVLAFETGPDVGSDHFALHATLCLDEARFEPRQEAPELTEEARENAIEELEAASDNVERMPSEELRLPED